MPAADAGVPDVLDRIVRRRRERLGSSGAAPRIPDAGGGPPVEDAPFPAALRDAAGPAVIAEVKMGSPKLGRLEGIDPEARAAAYAAGGASALSVVVEPDFFFGSWDLLRRCREASGLPTIAKDFVVAESQLDRARECGADAVLLIAALYDAAELRAWAAAARTRGLAPLVEVHSAEDVGRLAGAEWELVGVNNRDLRTFEVRLERSVDLLPSLPRGAIPVAESGIGGPEDVRFLAAAGFRAFLVGESLLLADDPAEAVRRLRGA